MHQWYIDTPNSWHIDVNDSVKQESMEDVQQLLSRICHQSDLWLTYLAAGVAGSLPGPAPNLGLHWDEGLPLLP